MIICSNLSTGPKQYLLKEMYLLYTNHCNLCLVIIEKRTFVKFIHIFKNARSVSLYPYIQSQILQKVKYTKKINIAKGFSKLCDN